MNRQEKIDKMIEEVDNWDTDSLVFYVQSRLQDVFSELTDSQIDNEFVAQGWTDDDEDQDCDEKDCEECCTKECDEPAVSLEEPCSRCKRTKDVGLPCWNCGCP
jgi:hypothetical protein